VPKLDGIVICQEFVSTLAEASREEVSRAMDAAQVVRVCGLTYVLYSLFHLLA